MSLILPSFFCDFFNTPVAFVRVQHGLRSFESNWTNFFNNQRHWLSTRRLPRRSPSEGQNDAPRLPRTGPPQRVMKMEELRLSWESKGDPPNATFPPRNSRPYLRGYENHHCPLIIPSYEQIGTNKSRMEEGWRISQKHGQSWLFVGVWGPQRIQPSKFDESGFPQ